MVGVIGVVEAAPSEEDAKGLVMARILVGTLVVTSSLRLLAHLLLMRLSY